MQVFHTAGDPPNNGSNNLPNKGCKTNIKEALRNSVAEKRKIKSKLRLDCVVDISGMTKKG